MLKVILYDRAKELYNTDYLENSDLSLTYIFPHPQLADDFRDRFNELGLLEKRDVITISNFLKEQDLENFKSKAQLIPLLIPQWKKRIENPTFEKFLHTFNLFTELRSFTLEFERITDILTEFDKDMAKGLLIFWNEVDTEKLVDEHQAYNLISQMDYSGEKKNLFFWGFGHLSGLQIDMLKSLSTYHDVYIPFPKNAFIKSHSTDWINWLDTTLVNDMEEVPRKLKGKMALFPKNKMSEYLRERIDPDEKTDYYLMSKDVSLEDINEIPQAGLNFKVKNDLYKNKIKDIFSKIKEQKFASKESLQKFLEMKIEEEKKRAFDAKDFRMLKTLLLIGDELTDWPYDDLSLLDIRIMEYLTELKAPRTFSAPILTSEEFGEIRGINRLGFYNSENRKVICVNGNYAPIKTSGSKYPERVEEFLRAIGPIQNNYLEYLQIKEHILEILEEENSLFFLEEGLQESDLAWEEIYFEIKGNILEKEDSKTPREKNDYLLPFIENETTSFKTISAKKLQTYLDCPRKYYFSYPKKIDLFTKPKCVITKADLGNMEHEVIDCYFREFSDWDSDGHERIVREVLDKYLTKKEVTEIRIKTALVEVKYFSANGIKELLKLFKIYPEATWEFEKKLPGETVSGSADLVIKTSKGVGLIDFKRSKSGMASKGELLGFEEIQLWFYLKHLNIEEDILFMGYLGLGNPEDSIFLVGNDLVKDLMKAEGFGNFKSTYVADPTIEEKLKKYDLVEEKLISDLSADTTWLPTPLNAGSCKYCTVENVCPKGIL